MFNFHQAGVIDNKKLVESKILPVFLCVNVFTVYNKEKGSERMYYNDTLPFNKNWRERIGKRLGTGEYDWRIHLQKEFVDFIKEIELLARLYGWNLWGGGVKNYAVTLSQIKVQGKSISIKMLSGVDYKYYVSFENEINPNNINPEEYKTKIGDTMDEALKYVHDFLNDNKYIKDPKEERFCFLGGAYDRYPVALHWERERIIEELEQKQLIG